MHKNLGDKIKKLRNKGYTYLEIKEELNCSKGTISYHLGDGQKQKSKTRQQNNRLGLYSTKVSNVVLNKKLNAFNSKENKSIVNIFLDKQEAIGRIINNPICYLTGRNIDLNNSSEYQLDHIVPISQGGTNSVDNLGLTYAKANQAKCDMTFEDFLDLCREILVYNGYTVERKITRWCSGSIT